MPVSVWPIASWRSRLMRSRSSSSAESSRCDTLRSRFSMTRDSSTSSDCRRALASSCATRPRRSFAATASRRRASASSSVRSASSAVSRADSASGSERWARRAWAKNDSIRAVDPFTGASAAAARSWMRARWSEGSPRLRARRPIRFPAPDSRRRAHVPAQRARVGPLEGGDSGSGGAAALHRCLVGMRGHRGCALHGRMLPAISRPHSLRDAGSGPGGVKPYSRASHRRGLGDEAHGQITPCRPPRSVHPAVLAAGDLLATADELAPHRAERLPE